MTERAVPEKSLSYGALVFQQFRKGRLAVLGLVLVCLLFVVGVFAPFIANYRPLIVRPDAGRDVPLVTYAGQEPVERSGWFSPVVENLTQSDVILIIVLVWVLLTLLFRLLTVPADSPARRAIRVNRKARTVISWCLTATALVLVVWTLNAPWRLPDTITDWKSIIRSRAKGDVFVMCPIPYRPYEQLLDERLQMPTWYHYLFPGESADAGKAPYPARGRWRWYHWLGTDHMGRDVAAQLVHGARISLSVGFVSVTIAIVIGTCIGAMGGYFGGKVDFWVMRLIEVMMCFPVLFLILTVSVIVRERSVFTVMAIIGVTSWTGSARLVRGEFLKQRAMEYVTAAQAIGGSPPRVMFRHILPNAMAPVLVSATFGIAGAIITESTLSFLGLGVPPDVASWGRTLSYGVEYIKEAAWLIIAPGVAIFLAVVSYNLAGEGLRDAVDPRMRT